jgi:hypothetical protein
MKKLYAFRFYPRLSAGKRGLPMIIFLEFDNIRPGTEFIQDYERVPEFDLFYN